MIAFYAWDTLDQRMGTSEFTNDIKVLDIASIPMFFGIAAYSFDSSALIMVLHKSMKKPEQFERTLTLVI